jgi:hypothetical protein
VTAQLNTASAKEQEAAKARAAASAAKSDTDRQYYGDLAQSLTNEAEGVRQNALTMHPDLIDVQEADDRFWGGKKRTYSLRPRAATSPQSTSQSSPTGSLPQLEEDKIRAAAIEKHLDPDEAVRRARLRKQL